MNDSCVGSDARNHVACLHGSILVSVELQTRTSVSGVAVASAKVWLTEQRLVLVGKG